jgi:hypothetical protein
MAYCNITTDLKQYGIYINRSAPTTTNTDWELYVNKAFRRINAELFKAGIRVPVSPAFPSAWDRLRHLNALGAIVEIEKAVASRGNPGGFGAQTVSDKYSMEFDETLKGYVEFPRSLFAEEETAGVDLSAAFGANETIAPESATAWSWNMNSTTKPQFSLSDFKW